MGTRPASVRRMTIEAGQKIPSATIKLVTPEGGKDVDPAVLFAGKHVVMFSLPGAFTPTCSAKHLPGYVANADALKAKGVDLIACLSVNDWFVMKAWADANDVGDKVAMLADGSGAFSKALGIEADLSGFGMGTRARRGLFIIKDGTVESVELEPAGAYGISDAAACVAKFA